MTQEEFQNLVLQELKELKTHSILLTSLQSSFQFHLKFIRLKKRNSVHSK